MKKKILSFILLLTLLLCFTGCNDTKKTTIRIASMKGPTSIGLAKLYTDSDADKTECSYNYSIYGTADEISAGLAKGDIDIAAVPCNLASVLYNQTEGDILIAGINTLGVLYVVEKNCHIETIQDLYGETLYSTGQGTTPEYAVNHILTSNGITPYEDITTWYCSEASEVVSTIAAQDKAIAILPQPYVTIAQNTIPGLRVSLDLTEEWEKINPDSAMVTGVIVVSKDFAEQYPNIVETFLEEYKDSTEYANTHVAECAQLLASLDIMQSDIAQKAIPECNVVLITGDEMESKVLSYLNVLYEANPDSIGGTLPDSAIFYK